MKILEVLHVTQHSTKGNSPQHETLFQQSIFEGNNTDLMYNVHVMSDTSQQFIEIIQFESQHK